MPGAEYNTEGPVGLRKLTGTSSGRQIGTGFQSLGRDVERHLQGVVSSIFSVTAEPGQMLLMEGTVTVTLPLTGEKSDLIGVFCKAGVTTIHASGTSHISGAGFVNEATSIKLLANQSVLLQRAGPGEGALWLIVAGEPTRETPYATRVERVVGTEYEPSSTRETFVLAELTCITSCEMRLHVGSVNLPEIKLTAAEQRNSISFFVPAGVKWKFEALTGTATLWSTYLPR
jgi:hypothetical protein